jgi:hypothetical protein
MAKQPMTKAAQKRALAEIHPDPEVARELIAMGVYRVRRDGRLRSGKCGAHARTTGKPCQAPAMENGRCRLHGGLSTGPRTKAGAKRSAAGRLQRNETLVGEAEHGERASR